MSAPEDTLSFDQRYLSDLYREYRLNWAKFLAKLGLPANIGIFKSMTLGQARALAARHAGL